MPDTRCLCGTAIPFAECCGRFLTGPLRPDTPEVLMRSRYSAFVGHNAAYLLETHHPSTRTADLAQGLDHTFRTTRWIGLRVLGSGMDPQDPDRGWVEFAAYHEGGQIHERSRFARADGNWTYLDGVHLAALAEDRNGPCPCRSGRKWKKCHGRHGA